MNKDADSALKILDSLLEYKADFSRHFKMQWKTLFFVIAFLFASLDGKCARTDSLLVRYSDWNRVTTNVSTCSNYEWRNGYEKEYLISSSCYIDSLKNLLANIQETDNIYFPVLCKLYIFDSDTVKQTICMNKAYLKYKGKTYTNNETIINYINHLMQMHTPYNSGGRFWPDITGANYIGGRSALYQLLTKKIDEITHQKSCINTIIMNITCRADKDGKTTDAEIKVVKPSQTTEIEKLIVKELKEYIINNIYWEEDLDREIYDVIYFTIRYH